MKTCTNFLKYLILAVPFALDSELISSFRISFHISDIYLTVMYMIQQNRRRKMWIKCKLGVCNFERSCKEVFRASKGFSHFNIYTKLQLQGEIL